jgi:hypothetical protein
VYNLLFASPNHFIDKYFFLFSSNKRLDLVSKAGIAEYVRANSAKELHFSSIYENSHFLAEQAVKNKYEAQKTLLVLW